MGMAPAARAGAAVGGFGDAVVAGDVVDHHGTGADARGDFAAAAVVGGPDAGAEAEGRIVGERDGCFGIRDGANGDHGAESFFAFSTQSWVKRSASGCST